MSDPEPVIPLRWEYPASWREYSEGYAKAIQLVLRELTEKPVLPTAGVNMYEPLGFPLLFLVRHYVELALKGLVLNASKLLKEEPPPVERLGHNLRKAWEKCEAVLPRAGFPIPGEARAIAQLVDWLSDLDERTTTFRYATDQSRYHDLPSEIRVSEFKEMFETAHRLLTGAQQNLKSELDFHGHLEA